MGDDFMMPCSGAEEESGASARHRLRLRDVTAGGGAKACPGISLLRPLASLFASASCLSRIAAPPT